MDSLNNRIPDLKLKIFGAGRHEFKKFEGAIKLNSWSGFQSRQGAYGSINNKQPSDGATVLSIGGDMIVDNPEILNEHVNAYHYLIQQQERIKENILRALLAKYKILQSLYGYDAKVAAAIMPDVDSVFQFKNLIGLSTVHLLNISKDDASYVGYEFGCSWDDEQGLGVMTHQDRVIEIGGADTSFLTWVAERDLDPEKVNAEIEATYRLAEERPVEVSNPATRKPWWRFW